MSSPRLRPKTPRKDAPLSQPEDTLRDLGALVRTDEAFARELEAFAAGSAAMSVPAAGSAKGLPPELLQGPSEALIQRITNAAQTSVAKRPVQLDRTTPTRSKLAATLFVPLALAAAWVLWLQQEPQSEAIAFYSARVEGSTARVRSVATKTETLRLRSNQRFELWLTPAHDVAGELTAKVYLVNSTRVELPAAVEPSAAGSLHLVLQTPPELPQTGQLVVLVGRPAMLEPQLLDAGEAFGQGWQRLTQAFEHFEP